MIEIINPYTEEVINTYKEISKNEISKKIDQSHLAYQDLKNKSLVSRADLLYKLADLLETDQEECAQLMTLEMGKPITQSIKEIEKCVRVCRYYADHAEQMIKKILSLHSHQSAKVELTSLGVVFAVMPWNFPFWQVFRFLAPGLMIGNTYLLKHAQNVLGCAEKIQELVRKAGYDEGVLNHLIINTDQIEFILSHPKVRASTLTGSKRAGENIGQLSGKYIKKSVLELGGSDPFLVLADADLEKAVQIGLQSRFNNSGQTCIAAKRFIIVDEVYDKFKTDFLHQMNQLKMGDPLDKKTDLGPLARKDLVISLKEQIDQSQSQGAKVIDGNQSLPRTGFFYSPQILENISKDSKAYSEELFGPVASFFRAKNLDQALHIANDTAYGLGASIFTKDIDQAFEIAKDNLEAGCIAINDLVRSDEKYPFGGVKESGYGRELSYSGLIEFSNLKTILV